MAAVGYAVNTGQAAQALTASVARTILGVRAGTAFGIQVKKWAVGFDGSAAAAGIGVELVSATFATNAPGTNSSSVTPEQIYGRTLAHGLTAARHWTTEPTVLDPRAMSSPMVGPPRCATARHVSYRGSSFGMSLSPE